MAYVRAEDGGSLENQARPYFVNYTPDATPYVFGTPYNVDHEKLVKDTSGKKIVSLDPTELQNLFTEASNHNTPITLDLSDTDIEEIGDMAFAFAPIHVLKLPATLTKIGDNAFTGSLIHQIYFKSDPSTIEIGRGAFTQASTNIVNGVKQNIQLVNNGAGGKIPLPIGQDFVFYGMIRDPKAVNSGFIGEQDNPYFIDVNGQKTYATLTSNNPELFHYPTGRVTPSPKIHINPYSYTRFSRDKLQITSNQPVEYNLEFTSKNGQVQLKGENFIAFNRVSYLDVTPRLNEQGQYQLNLLQLGESTGLDANILTVPLQQEGYAIVGLNEIYPNMSLEDIKNLVSEIQTNQIIQDYRTDSVYGGSPLTSHINKKYIDLVFVAKPAKINYIYVDKDSGEHKGAASFNTYVGLPLPKFELLPDGYIPFVKDLKIYQVSSATTL